MDSETARQIILSGEGPQVEFKEQFRVVLPSRHTRLDTARV
jgi:hypothetical protein